MTAGSPLRKYVDLFYWGMDTGSMCSMPAPGGWMNFWDPVDPVGDPLGPSPGWRRGDSLPLPEQSECLFEHLDPVTGERLVFPIVDKQVDNMTNSLGSGLRAHNYWDNNSREQLDEAT